jgi:hypothetical protein
VKIANEKLSKQRLLKIVGYTIVFAGIITALLYYYSTSYASLRSFVYGNSDMLQLASVYNDVINGIDLSHWKLSEASFFFPDLLIYFLARGLTLNIFIAQSIYGMIQFIVFTLGLIFLSKLILPPFYGSARYSIVALMALLFSFTISKLHWLSNMVFVNEQHFGVVVTIPWVLAIICRLITKPRLNTSLIIVLCIISFLTSASDRLYLVQVTTPLCFCLLILYLLRKDQLRRIVISSAAIVFSSLAGLILDYVNPLTFKYRQSVFNVNQMNESFFNLIGAFKSVIHRYPLHAALIFIVTSACIYYIIKYMLFYIKFRSFSTLNMALLIFPLYFIISNIINVLVLIVFGRMCGSICFRYLLPFFIFSSWWGVPFLLRIPRFINPIHFQGAIQIVLALVVILALGSVSMQVFIWNISSIYYPSFIKCIDDNTTKLGITYGVSNYWQARPITLLSQKGTKVVAVNSDLTPFYWETNLDWFSIEPEFIIVDQSIPISDAMRIDDNRLISLYGVPDTTFRCEESQVLVYNRPGSKLRMLFNNLLPK